MGFVICFFKQNFVHIIHNWISKLNTSEYYFFKVIWHKNPSIKYRRPMEEAMEFAGSWIPSAFTKYYRNAIIYMNMGIIRMQIKGFQVKNSDGCKIAYEPTQKMLPYSSLLV